MPCIPPPLRTIPGTPRNSLSTCWYFVRKDEPREVPEGALRGGIIRGITPGYREGNARHLFPYTPPQPVPSLPVSTVLGYSLDAGQHLDRITP